MKKTKFLIEVFAWLFVILLFATISFADNLNVTEGSGKVLATDTVGGFEYQKFKLYLGAENAVDMALDSGQQTMANSLPVTIASDQSSLTCSVSGSGATSLLKNEDVAHVNADAGVQVLAVRNESLTRISASDDGDYVPFSVNGLGAINVDVRRDAQYDQNYSLLHLEDEAAINGAAGVMALGVRNTSLSTFSASDQDYIPFAVGAQGQQYMALDADMQPISTSSPIRREDDAFGASNGGMVAFGQAQDPLTIDQGANGDVGPLKQDRTGRLINTPYAPAGESWESCTGVISNTTPTAIKAAVASNRIYVTSVQCINNSTVASHFLLQDGTGSPTTISVGFMGSNAAGGGGHWETTYPTPLRLTSATAFNVTMAQTATSTICCGQGFISTN